MHKNTDILQTLEELEQKLRKDIRNNEYFGDSYICGIADKLHEIQKKIKTLEAFGH
jgi:hypothetical protein